MSIVDKAAAGLTATNLLRPVQNTIASLDHPINSLASLTQIGSTPEHMPITAMADAIDYGAHYAALDITGQPLTDLKTIKKARHNIDQTFPGNDNRAARVTAHHYLDFCRAATIYNQQIAAGKTPSERVLTKYYDAAMALTLDVHNFVRMSKEEPDADSDTNKRVTALFSVRDKIIGLRQPDLFQDSAHPIITAVLQSVGETPHFYDSTVLEKQSSSLADRLELEDKPPQAREYLGKLTTDYTGLLEPAVRRDASVALQLLEDKDLETVADRLYAQHQTLKLALFMLIRGDYHGFDILTEIIKTEMIRHPDTFQEADDLTKLKTDLNSGTDTIGDWLQQAVKTATLGLVK